MRMDNITKINIQIFINKSIELARMLFILVK